MRRTLAKLAEVARRAHDPLAEVHFQMRFTITRAVSGLPGLTIDSASSSRPLPLVKRGGSPSHRMLRFRLGATSPKVVASPRIATRTSAGFLESRMACRNGYCFGALSAASPAFSPA